MTVAVITAVAVDLTEEDINYRTTSMNKGTIKFFNESKGFGFVKDADSPKEYFVHSSGLKDFVKENDEVTFDLEEGKRGLNAVNVRRAK